MALYIIDYMSEGDPYPVVEIRVKAESFADAVAIGRASFMDTCVKYPGRSIRGFQVLNENLDVVRPYRSEAN